MAVKKPSPRTASSRTGVAAVATVPAAAAGSPEERVERMHALGDRIAGYIQFMCRLSASSSASAEARERAVGVFYERLILAERALGRVQEEFELE